MHSTESEEKQEINISTVTVPLLGHNDPGLKRQYAVHNFPKSGTY